MLVRFKLHKYFNLTLHYERIKKKRFLFLLFIKLDVSSLTVQTEDTIVVTQEDDSIYLNCTYQMESIAEGINNRKIQWQKKIQNEFKVIAAFSPPGGEEPFIVIEMQDLYNNRTTLIGPNVSLSAVMIIENPVCSDKGIYQCLIEYFIPFSDGIKQTNRSVVLFHGNYILFHFNMKLHDCISF